jgi:hypothetical protein
LRSDYFHLNNIAAALRDITGSANEPGLVLALGCFQHAVKLRAMTGVDTKQYRDVSAQAAGLQSKISNAASSSRGLEQLQADK